MFSMDEEGNDLENERSQSFGSDDAVIILNPTKYTLREEVDSQ